MKKLSILVSVVVLIAAVAVGVLTGQKSDLSRQVKELKGKVESAAAESEELKAGLSKAEEAMAAAETAKAEVEKTLAETKDALAKRVQHQTTASVKLVTTRNMLTAAREEVAALKTAQEDLTKELEAARGGKTEAPANDKALAEADAQIKGLEAALSEAKAAVEAKDAKIAELEAAVEELKKQAAPAAPAEAGKAGKAGEYTAEAQGFESPIAVTATIDENGVITAIKVGDDRFNETIGFGYAVSEPEFTQKLIGKQLPLEIKDIDAVSGATISSQAVVDALNLIAQQAGL